MAQSYVDYCGNYVLLRDEHIVWLMESVLRETNFVQMPSGLTSLLGWWKAKRNTFGPGCIELPLDEFLQDLKSAEMLTEILALLASKLREAGSVVHGEEFIQTVQTNHFIVNDEGIARLCNIIDKVKNLIESVHRNDNT